jgi:hypothetical protein
LGRLNLHTNEIAEWNTPGIFPVGINMIPASSKVWFLEQGAGHILHDWGLEEKRQLIAKAHAALPKDGALIVCEAVIDDQRRQNTFGLLMGLNMLIEHKPDSTSPARIAATGCATPDSRKHASNRSAARTQWWLGLSDLELPIGPS